VTAGRALAGVAIASLLVAAACRRKTPEVATLPESFARFELSAGAGGKDAGPTAARAGGPAQRDVFIQQAVPRELSDLLRAGQIHRAVASLEAAGCDQAFVMTGGIYDRLVELSHGTKMPKQIDDPASLVVYCSSRTDTPPPDCASLAPIFARVARPKRKFHVFSGFGPPPFAPRCSGVHDAKGKIVSGEGPGYGQR